MHQIVQGNCFISVRSQIKLLKLCSFSTRQFLALLQAFPHSLTQQSPEEGGTSLCGEAGVAFLLSVFHSAFSYRYCRSYFCFYMYLRISNTNKYICCSHLQASQSVPLLLGSIF